MSGNFGKVVQVMGPVVDVQFPPGQLPNILSALKLSTLHLRRGRDPHPRWLSTSGRGTVRAIPGLTTAFAAKVRASQPSRRVGPGCSAAS